MIPRHRFQRLHFVGVGGAGMAPLAAWFAARAMKQFSRPDAASRIASRIAKDLGGAA